MGKLLFCKFFFILSHILILLLHSVSNELLLLLQHDLPFLSCVCHLPMKDIQEVFHSLNHF